LRELVRPFVLRRLKSDPTSSADLPEKLETREYRAPHERAGVAVRDTCVRMLGEVERAEGIQRRGLVLATLIKLKQVCNHPGQLLKDHGLGSGSSTVPDIHRSGKCTRILEMLDEIVAEGDKALVFTQFREMGEMLAAMLRHELDREVLLSTAGRRRSSATRSSIASRTPRWLQAPVLS
jgi:SNF2 family DNA or RNA helicase